jgi:hypothetical protein
VKNMADRENGGGKSTETGRASGVSELYHRTAHISKKKIRAKKGNT